MRRMFLSLAGFALVAAPATAREPDAPLPAPAVQSPGIFVAAAHPLAVEAGLTVLRRGGSAVDAAVAVQAMLGLVEPQSSGLGGGSFLMYYNAATKKVSAWSGRERAPKGATPDMLLDEDGKPLKRSEAMMSGRATGVPGVVAMLSAIQAREGKLAWNTLFEDVAKLAEAGFAISPRLAGYISGDYPQSKAADVTAYFTRPDGSRMQAGDTLRNPAYARFVRRLAAEGHSAFYKGETAARIVARVREGANPGLMTLEDLAGYQPQKIVPLCRVHVQIICAPPPPATGVGTLQLLGLLDRTDIAKRGPGDPQAWYLFAEASRVMYADRDRWVGDPDFVNVPVQGLLDPGYMDKRAKLIGPKAGNEPLSGRPPGADPVAKDATQEPAGTTHFVIIDASGNAVSMTSTVESYFGSGRMVDGFFLNNQMTDFSFSPVSSVTGRPVANAIASGKRPRSSMSPLLILDKTNNLVGALGSPGGNAIPAYVAKTVIGVFDWGLSMQTAIDLPNLVARDKDFNGEEHRMTAPVLAGLKARGVVVKRGSGEESGLQGVIIRDGKFDGGADARRDGVARSEPAPAGVH